MAYPCVDKKILVIKANWYLLTLNQNRTHSVTVCFNKHIGNSVLTINWSVFPIAGCNPVVILSGVATRGSIPSRSTKFMDSSDAGRKLVC